MNYSTMPNREPIGIFSVTCLVLGIIGIILFFTLLILAAWNLKFLSPVCSLFGLIFGGMELINSNTIFNPDSSRFRCFVIWI